MLPLRRNTEPDALKVESDRVLRNMQDTVPWNEEYTTMVNHLSKLNEIKACQAKKTINPDTWAIIAANLLGIVLILHYERADIVTSKAIGFVSKLK
jgi:hypothetical protein